LLWNLPVNFTPPEDAISPVPAVTVCEALIVPLPPAAVIEPFTVEMVPVPVADKPVEDEIRPVDDIVPPAEIFPDVATMLPAEAVMPAPAVIACAALIDPEEPVALIAPFVVVMLPDVTEKLPELITSPVLIPPASVVAPVTPSVVPTVAAPEIVAETACTLSPTTKSSAIDMSFPAPATARFPLTVNEVPAESEPPPKTADVEEILSATERSFPAPITFKLPVIFVAPVTSSVLVNVVAPFAANVVKAPELLVEAPIGVLLIEVAVNAPASNVPVVVLPSDAVPAVCTMLLVNVETPFALKAPSTIVRLVPLPIVVFAVPLVLIFVAPATSSVLVNVVAPFAANVVKAPELLVEAPIGVLLIEVALVAPSVVAPVDDNVVNAPVLVAVAPIGVPSIVPPLMSAFDVINPPLKVDKPVTFSVLPRVVALFAFSVVNIAAAGVTTPIVVASIVPP